MCRSWAKLQEAQPTQPPLPLAPLPCTTPWCHGGHHGAGPHRPGEYQGCHHHWLHLWPTQRLQGRPAATGLGHAGHHAALQHGGPHPCDGCTQGVRPCHLPPPHSIAGCLSTRPRSRLTISVQFKIYRSAYANLQVPYPGCPRAITQATLATVTMCPTLVLAHYSPPVHVADYVHQGGHHIPHHDPGQQIKLLPNHCRWHHPCHFHSHHP